MQSLLTSIIESSILKKVDNNDSFELSKDILDKYNITTPDDIYSKLSDEESNVYSSILNKKYYMLPFIQTYHKNYKAIFICVMFYFLTLGYKIKINSEYKHETDVIYFYTNCYHDYLKVGYRLYNYDVGGHTPNTEFIEDCKLCNKTFEVKKLMQ